MKKKILCGLVCLVFCLLLPLAACDDPEEEEPTLEEVLAIGKGYLAAGDAVGASDAFHAALVMAPQNTDAKFGALLANTLQFTTLLSELLNLVEDMLDAGDSVPVDVPDELDPLGRYDALGSGPPIGDLIQDFVTNVALPKFLENDVFYYELTLVDGFSFHLDGTYDVEITGTQLISFGGEFDYGELHFFGAVNSLLLAVFEIVLAHDINFDFDNLNLDFGEDADTLETIGAILDLIEGLLNDPNYPNFLFLDDDGVQQMQMAGVNLGLAFLRINAMLDAVRAETDDQSDDPIRYDDANGNGVYDLDEAVEIPGLLVMEPDLIEVVHNLAGDLAVAFFDTTALDVDPINPNPLYLSSLNGILIYLGILPEPLFGERIGIPIGPFFAQPSPNGLRNILIFVVNVWDLVEGLLD